MYTLYTYGQRQDRGFCISVQRCHVIYFLNRHRITNFCLLGREKFEVVNRLSTYHEPLGVLLYMFVCGNGNGHCLLVTVVIVGLDILASFQPISLLNWNRQHSQNQLFLSCTDQVHHLLMGGTFHAHAITGEKVK